MKFLLLLTLLISSPPLFGQTNVPAADTNAVMTPPPIPEEARKHFVMGTALFKDAKTPDDYSQVIGEFKQAATLAPQWPDPRYDLAVAEEAAGDFSSAEADLKIYQKFKLSAEDARAAQDKIYVLEAKQQKQYAADRANALEVARQKKAAADAADAKAAAKEKVHQDMLQFIQRLQGTWSFSSYTSFYARLGIGSPNWSGQVSITVNNNKILIVFGNDKEVSYEGTLTGDDLASIKWVELFHNPPLAVNPITATVDPSGSRIYFKFSSFVQTGNNDDYQETTFTR
jgi:hypothetical protein